MGLMKKIGSAVKTAAVASVNPAAIPMAGLALAKGKDHQPSPNDANAAGERAAAAHTKQSELAEDYRQNLPGYKEAAFGYAADESRQNLAKQMAGIKSSANSRGLLYSGLKSGAENSALSQHMGGLSQSRYDINSQFDDQANEMENKSILSGFQNLATARGAADADYQLALQQRAERDKGIGSLLGAGGSIIGGQMGKQAGGAAPGAASTPTLSGGSAGNFRGYA